MSEFIGSRISLISKSNIRYVGTLVEINSEASTVSLDNVRSFGTEGREGGAKEMPPSAVVYEQIVFRGSDVKDLRIEESAEKAKPAPPPMPDDPAIIGVQQNQNRQETPSSQAQRPNQPPQNFPQQGQFPPGGYPPFGGPFQNQRFGPGPQGGFPGGPGFPGYGMPGPYGVPPGGWYPPGQGFNQGPGPFPHMPGGPLGGPQQNLNQAQPPQGPRGPAAPIGPPAIRDERANMQPKVAEADSSVKSADVKPASKPSTPAPIGTKQPPPPPVESKPDVAAALAPPPTQPAVSAATTSKAPPTGPKSSRIVPAVPRSPAVTKAQATGTQPTTAAPAPQYQNAAQAAKDAVAAAMAKLDLAAGQKPSQLSGSAPMDNLTRKVIEMRADDNIRHGRQQGTGGFAAGHRGAGRGRGRGGHHYAKVEVPTTDYDFESANAKFNKQDLVKEAIASGSPLGGDIASSPTDDPNTNGQTNGAAEKSADKDVVIPTAAGYDKGSSFFDNISSEIKDREEAAARPGREFRQQERQKNMETFGQGSVDGYRGGYRGRGRGRGFRGGRGGGYYRGRAPRGRGGAQDVGEGA